MSIGLSIANIQIKNIAKPSAEFLFRIITTKKVVNKNTIHAANTTAPPVIILVGIKPMAFVKLILQNCVVFTTDGLCIRHCSENEPTPGPNNFSVIPDFITVPFATSSVPFQFGRTSTNEILVHPCIVLLIFASSNVLSIIKNPENKITIPGIINKLFLRVPFVCLLNTIICTILISAINASNINTNVTFVKIPKNNKSPIVNAISLRCAEFILSKKIISNPANIATSSQELTRLNEDTTLRKSIPKDWTKN